MDHRYYDIDSVTKPKNHKSKQKRYTQQRKPQQYKPPLKPCLICTSSSQTWIMVTLPCLNVVCSKCITDWTIAQIEQLDYLPDRNIRCVTRECSKHLNIKQVLERLKKWFRLQINEALFKDYLNRAQDIRKCPKPSCNYAGIVNISRRCNARLECGKCRTKWKDAAFLTDNARRDLQKNEELCNGWKKNNTRECPRCKVKIEKNGGCDHMTCTKCKYEFLWSSGEQYVGIAPTEEQRREQRRLIEQIEQMRQMGRQNQLQRQQPQRQHQGQVQRQEFLRQQHTLWQQHQQEREQQEQELQRGRGHGPQQQWQHQQQQIIIPIRSEHQLNGRFGTRIDESNRRRWRIKWTFWLKVGVTLLAICLLYVFLIRRLFV